MAARPSVWIAATLLLAGCGATPSTAQIDSYASGGELSQDQASFDVTFYDLDLRISPSDSSIAGAATTTAAIVQPTAWLVLDLDPRLRVDGVWEEGAAATGADAPRSHGAAAPTEAVRQGVHGVARPFTREGGKLRIDLEGTRRLGSTVTVRVAYGGKPRVAPNPPWDGGLTWARTPGGEPWIATSCQVTGADVWWPVKDHPSDEADSVAIHFTVPEGLVAASNGRLVSVVDAEPGWRTFNWFVSTPINTYNVALNAAPYVTIEDVHAGPNGETYPVELYVLPQNEARGRAFMDEIHRQLTFFEERFGPYPFRADKYGVVQTPHLGMEHQTIIAYGADFDNAAMTGIDWGFDALHHHELSHEWWGNLVTNVDWTDMWIHEGFGTYTQALYMEELEGASGYHAYMDNLALTIQNAQAVAPFGHLNSREIYGGDIYNKGAWVLHMLRYVIGDDALFDRLLRRMAYPDPSLEAVTDGRQTRQAESVDFIRLAEEMTGRELDWFFDVYLRQPDLPRLAAVRQGNRLTLRWDSPVEGAFPMPVEVELGAQVVRVDMTAGEATIRIPDGAQPIVDPDNWVLAEGA